MVLSIILWFFYRDDDGRSESEDRKELSSSLGPLHTDSNAGQDGS